MRGTGKHYQDTCLIQDGGISTQSTSVFSSRFPPVLRVFPGASLFLARFFCPGCWWFAFPGDSRVLAIPRLAIPNVLAGRGLVVLTYVLAGRGLVVLTSTSNQKSVPGCFWRPAPSTVKSPNYLPPRREIKFRGEIKFWLGWERGGRDTVVLLCIDESIFPWRSSTNSVCMFVTSTSKYPVSHPDGFDRLLIPSLCPLPP